MRFIKISRQKTREIVFFFILFLVTVILINPIGEFALNDDWTHTITIIEFAKSNSFHYFTGQYAFNLPITLYGILISKLFGFSFTILRIGNILLAAASIITTYAILKELKIKKNIALIVSTLLWFNPIVLNLAFTFMGDVIAMLLVLLASFFYIKGVKKQDITFILIASLISILAFYSRQITILLPISVGVWLLYRRIFPVQKLIFVFVAPLLVLLAIYLPLSSMSIIDPDLQLNEISRNINARFILVQLWDFVSLAAFFISPIILAIFAKNIHWLKDRLLSLLIIALLVSALVISILHHTFPQPGNIITRVGIGPSIDVLMMRPNQWGPNFIYDSIHYLIAIVIAIFIFIVTRNTQHLKIFSTKYNFLWIFLVLFIASLLGLTSFDRYLVLVIPIIYILGAILLSKFEWSKAVFFISAALLVVYSIIGTHNYLEWNRGKTNFANDIIAKYNLGPRELDAGYEWLGIVCCSIGKTGMLEIEIPQINPGHLTTQNLYSISFSPTPRAEVIEEYKINGWFSNIKKLYLNKKIQ